MLPFVYTIRHPHEYGPSLLFVLTVTPIDRLHDGNRSNGVRGQLKRIKYEIRLGEPNRPMSTSPKKIEPILRVGP